jgi:hypothetical protein
MDFAKELAKHLPDVSRQLVNHVPTNTDDLIRLIGLQRQRTASDALLPSMALFGAGLLVGAGLALLLAPTTGKQLRDELGERAADIKDRVGAAAEQANQHNAQ